MKKFLLLFLLLQPVLMRAQTVTVGINQTGGIYDSTFVIQTGTVDSFHQGNHPGAGPYMNGEIYVCANATLKYNYPPGTSSFPTFYLEENAQVIFYQLMMSGLIYMKNGASVNLGHQTVYLNFKRVSGSSILNAGAGSTLQDSIFTTVNYTFNGWPGNSSPCQAPTALAEQKAAEFSLYPNPCTDRLFLEGPAGLQRIRVMNATGQILWQEELRSAQSSLAIPVAGLAPGHYVLTMSNEQGQVFARSFTKW